MQRPLLRRRLTVVAPVLAILCSAVQLFAADAIPAERRLGTDVVAFVSVRNINDLKGAWGKTQLGQLVQDKELAPFLKQFEPHWQKLTGEFEKEVGIPLNDVLTVPHGEVAVAVVSSGGKPMGLAAFLDFGEKKEVVDKLLEKMDKAITESDKAKRSEEDVEGTPVVVYNFPQDEEEGDGDDKAKKPKNPNALTYFIKDSNLVFASRVDIVKNILTRWDGQHEKTFAEKQVYKYLKDRCKGENAETVPHVTFFIDPIGILKGALSMNEATSSQSTMILATLPTLGLDKLKGFGGTLDLGTDEFDTVSRMLVYVEQPPSGVLNAFQFPVKDLSPPKWVSAGVSTYGALNWDLQAVYTTVETLFDTFKGQGALEKVIDDLATQEDGPKIHLKKDFVDQVTGTITIVGNVPENGEELSGERYLIGVELKDEGALRKVMERLADLEGFPGKVREFEGEKIFEMPVDREADDDKGAAYHPAVSIVKKNLMFATHVAELEAIMRADGDKEPLSDSEAYKSIAKRIPEQTSSISFQRSDAQLKMIYEALKSGALTEALSQDDFELDTSTLPEFSVLKKYFLPSGGYMKPDERGWFMMGFSLRAKSE